MKGQLKKQRRLERQQQLLSHFDGDFYQEKKVGDEWYVKMWNGGTDKWQVAIFSAVSFRRYKSFQHAKEINDDMEDAIENDTQKIPFERPTLESIKKIIEAK